MHSPRQWNVVSMIFVRPLRLAIPCWWVLTRRKQLSMAGTARVDWAIFVWPWKTVSVSVRYLFHLPPVKKIKTGPRSFPAKENPDMEKASFNWPIVFLNTDWRQSSRKCLMFAKPTKGCARLCLFAWPTKLIAIFLFVCCFGFVRS